jgi:hypothetical protein
MCTKRVDCVFKRCILYTQLKDLLKEADVGEDFRVDPALDEACRPVVETACREIKPGDARYVYIRKHLQSLYTLLF